MVNTIIFIIMIVLLFIPPVSKWLGVLESQCLSVHLAVCLGFVQKICSELLSFL